ncbi:MAG TPA: FAD-dependent oxidoreductase, partial [bacterium]|nr:FAD-dependent oxidoreductase [bacterium]
MAEFNVVVIGGGSAGLMVAAGCAGLGARVALVEAHQMGGDCLNTGCVPSKALIRSAAVARLKARTEAAVPAGGAAPEWSAVAARVQGVIAQLAPHDSVDRFQSLGVQVHLGRARLLSATRVEVHKPAAAAQPGSPAQSAATVQLEGRALVLATGSRPAVPAIPGLKEAGYVTNETVFAMPSLPRRLLVLGGGPIGLELGQALARLGSQVTVAEALPRLLPREDEDAAALVRQALEEDGLAVHTGARVAQVHATPGGKRVLLERSGAGPLTLEVDQILVATGRQPNVDGLGLEQAGVAVD